MLVLVVGLVEAAAYVMGSLRRPWFYPVGVGDPNGKAIAKWPLQPEIQKVTGEARGQQHVDPGCLPVNQRLSDPG